MTGIELIAEERQRQIKQEGWTPEHDDEQESGELALAAACYAVEGDDAGCFVAEPVMGEDAWPWSPEWDKRKKHDRVRRLAIAGALIAAEIDRLQRAARLEAGDPA